MTSRRILAVGAHPDDWECGAGATLLKHVLCGDEVEILVLTRGEKGGEDPAVREAEAAAAAAFLGGGFTIAALPDTAVFEKAAIDVIEGSGVCLAPDIAYVHSVHDTHQDHRAAALAARVALRKAGSVYAFQSPSATSEFTPQRFPDVTLTMDGKLELLGFHKSQGHRHYMQPAFVVACASYWGVRAGRCAAAEALEVIVDRDASAARF